MTAVRELAGIVNVTYRKTHPALLELWKAAARVESGPGSQTVVSTPAVATAQAA